MYDFALVFSLLHAHREAHMALTREQIASIATLARLELTPEEIPVYQESLSKIIDFVGTLDRIDTRGVEPMAHPLPGLSQRLRPDVVTEADRHTQYQANAQQVAAGLYLVPRVIE
jgi:aspartyl-tRNA(Asn)/glutamyl-tRNA(Gln) amidotransferase subunit C